MNTETNNTDPKTAEYFDVQKIRESLDKIGKKIKSGNYDYSEFRHEIAAVSDRIHKTKQELQERQTATCQQIQKIRGEMDAIGLEMQKIRNRENRKKELERKIEEIKIRISEKQEVIDTNYQLQMEYDTRLRLEEELKKK